MMKTKLFSFLATLLVVSQLFVAPTIGLANQIESTEPSSSVVEKEKQEEQATSQVTEEQDEEISQTDSKNTLKVESFTETNARANDSPYELNSFRVGYTTEGEIITSSYNPMQAFSRSSIGNSSGKLSKIYGGYETSTSYITVGGKVGWCIDPSLDFPVNIEYAKEVYNDLGVMNILYYAELWGWNQSNSNYVDVYVALNLYLGHFADPSGAMRADANVSALLEKANIKDAPIGVFDFTNKTQTAIYNTGTKQQETNFYEAETDTNNVEYTITVPEGLTAVTDTGKTLEAGTHTLSQTEKFKLVAPATYTGTVSFDVPTNLSPMSALKFNPSSSNVQRIVSAGTVTDPITVTGLSATFQGIAPKIGTLATGINGEKVVMPLEKTELTDVVSYEGLTPLVEKELVTVLVDKNNPTEILAQSTMKFTPETHDGTVTVKIEVDGSKLVGKEVVFYEYVKEGDKEIVKHEDPEDEGQTIKFTNPTLGTKATGENGEKEFDPNETITVQDTMSYTGLLAGIEHGVVTKAVDKATGEVIKEERTTFTPEKESGEYVVKMTLNGKELAGKDIVFYEYFYVNDKPLVKHEDINDKDQTVKIKPLPVTPTKVTSSVKTSVPTSSLPQTGEKGSLRVLMYVGLLVLIFAIALVKLKTKQSKQ